MSTINVQSTGEELIDQMELVRRRLDADVDSVRTTVGELTDWRHIVRKHPVATVAVSGVVGYLLVPNRRFENVVDVETLEKLTDHQRLLVAPKGTVPEESSISSKLIAFLGAGALRFAGAYLMNRLSEKSTNSVEHNSVERGA